MQLRNFTCSKFLNRQNSHYDSLGLSKNATQADIKTAYYELSKVYHPDRSQGLAHTEENEQKFRDITEAYEILGNVKSRKLYDKGFIGNSPSSTTATTDDPLHKFYKSREVRSRPPTPTGNVPIYNFDEWAKMHYGNTFRKSQQYKKRQAFREQMAKEHDEKLQTDKLLLFITVFCACCFLYKMFYYEDYDKNTINFVGHNSNEHIDEKSSPND